MDRGKDMSMPGKKQSRGICSYCGEEAAKSAMARHLAGCVKRKEAIEKADQGPGTAETIYHLSVRDAYQSEFWLHLEMPGSRTLKDLDTYLRRIWLECCGHMSRFSVGGWEGKEIAKTRKISQAFQTGDELTHIYDFGTPSETLIKLADTRQGKPITKHPVELMARNMMPEAQCIECDKPATHLCMECLMESEMWGVFCEEHAEAHPHKGYGEPVALVNSPRLGMCGYTGPADPPY